MAKESMKAREVKRQRMVAKYAERKAALKKAALADLTIVVQSPDVLKDICVNSVFHVSNSVKWLLQD